MDETASPPTLTVGGQWNWEHANGEPDRSALAAALAQAIVTRRWFGAKTRTIEAVELVDAIGIAPAVWLLLAKITFDRGPAEVYQVPLGFSDAVRAAGLLEHGTGVWMHVKTSDGRTLGVLYDALDELDFCRELLALFESPGTISGSAGELVVRETASYDRLRGDRRDSLPPKLVRAEQSNTSVIYGERLILKVFRRIEMGLNPDFEISDFLTRRHFASTPPLAGALEYQTRGGETLALAMLQAFVPNQGDAWRYTLDWLEKSLSGLTGGSVPPSPPPEGMLRAAERPLPPEAQAAFGEFLETAALLGTRTAEMHLALASDADDAAFAPEAFSEQDRRAFWQRCTDEARATFDLLSEHAGRLSGEVGEQANRVAGLEHVAIDRYARLASDAVDLAKIRCHGDYHLGQVLAAGGDFVIIDFEGEPVRTIAQRRQKQLALRDVAGMIRSLHYASCAAAAAATASPSGQDNPIRQWTRAWYAWTSTAFLAAYRQTAGEALFLPQGTDPFERLLGGCLLEKALYELRYELNNRPDWVYLPLAALADLLGSHRR